MLRKELLYTKIPTVFLLIHLLLGLGYGLYLAWFTDTLGGDTLEHIHASWLVYAGFIPYKDFFEHHNPLLWYVFSQIAGLHSKGIDDNIITALAISSAIIVSFINYFYLYLITKRFLSTDFSGVMAASIALTPYMFLSIIHFRPDNFMLASFFAGLYYYFAYLEEKKTKQLAFAFMLFWCSFMFLQKIIFTLLILGIITIYLLHKKKIKFTDFLYALMLPITLSLGFFAYLYVNSALYLWYQSNFTFNLYIPELFADHKTGTIWPELYLILMGSTLAILFCIKKSKIYFKILSILFIAELVQRLFYFSAFAYYFCLLVYLASMLSAVLLEEKVLKRYHWAVYILVTVLLGCMYKPAIYEGNIGQRVGHFYEPLNKEVVRLSNPCDYILNGDGSIYNLYNRDPHYYWMLLGQIDVIGAKVGIHPLMDINKVIEVYKPKIISVKPYYDKYAMERGQEIIIHQPDMNIVNKYYKPLKNSETLYIRKPEVAPVKCDYNYKKRYYFAHD